MTNQVNTVVLQGYASAPEVRGDENKVTVFSMINYEDYKSGDEWKTIKTSVDCKAYGKFGESIANKLKSGDEVLIQASLDQNTWTTDEGANRSKIELKVKSYNIISSKADREKLKPKE